MVSDGNYAAKSQSDTIILRTQGVKAAISDWLLLAENRLRESLFRIFHTEHFMKDVT